MDLTLSRPSSSSRRARARSCADVLQPLEEEFERAGGRLSRKQGAELRAAAIEARLHGGTFPTEPRRPGLDGARAGPRPRAARPGDRRPLVVHPGRLQRARSTRRPEQRARYLDPSLRGERSGSYAITEPNAGSDARTLEATAVRDPATGDYVLNGEKWFVTGPRRHRLHDLPLRRRRAATARAGRRSSSSTTTRPACTLTHDPDYMHTFADRHPQFVLEDVRVPASAILGGIGEADELTNEWFVEERIHIGARCAGAMERLLDAGRRVGDRTGSSSASGSSTSRACRSRSPTRRPTRPRRAC